MFCHTLHRYTRSRKDGTGPRHRRTRQAKGVPIFSRRHKLEPRFSLERDMSKRQKKIQQIGQPIQQSRTLRSQHNKAVRCAARERASEGWKGVVVQMSLKCRDGARRAFTDQADIARSKREAP